MKKPKFEVGQYVELTQYYAGIPIYMSGPVHSGPSYCTVGGEGYYVTLYQYNGEGAEEEDICWLPAGVLAPISFLDHLVRRSTEEAEFNNDDLS